MGIVIDKSDNIYVADQTNNQIRKITPNGQNLVYTSGFPPGHMILDDAGNLYVNVGSFAGGMNKVIVTGNYSKIAGPNWPMGRGAVDASNTIYYPDANNNSSNAVITTTAAGQTRSFVGFSDGGTNGWNRFKCSVQWRYKRCIK